MEKKRLFQILARADRKTVMALAAPLRKNYSITVVREPNKTLTMVKLRESVRESLFYIGEVMVTEAIVELDGARGIAVTMGDDFDKTLSMAIIDAAMNRGVFKDEEFLLFLESAQLTRICRENAMHLQTMVSFHSMDPEVPGK